MNPNDFYYMLRGKQLRALKKDDFSLLQAVNQRGNKTDRAILLLHGFTSSPAVFRYLIPHIKHYDALFCPQLPGHGESIAAFSQVKAIDWLNYTKQECAQLFEKYKKVDVLGLSLGGLLACKLSTEFAFNHMFLLAPAFKLHMDIDKNLMLLRSLKKLGFCEVRGTAGNILSDLYEEISFRKIPINAIIEFFHFLKAHQWVEPSLQIDLFLGKYDIVVDSQQVEKLFANSAHTSIHWLKNSAHVLPLDNDLKEIIKCINLKSEKN
jgi:carboxylesterase